MIPGLQTGLAIIVIACCIPVAIYLSVACYVIIWLGLGALADLLSRISHPKDPPQ